MFVKHLLYARHWVLLMNYLIKSYDVLFIIGPVLQRGSKIQRLSILLKVT